MAKAVFFSYAREDVDTVSTIAGSIRSAGFATFFDRDIVGGQHWWDRLLTTIEQCDVFVPVLSAAYLRSVPCRIEVSYAVALGKTLVPIDLGAGTLFGAAFIEPIKAAQWISYDRDQTMPTVLNLVGAINHADSSPPLPIGVERPPAPGADVLATSVRLVGSPNPLTETEQWAVVGELRAHMKGENSGAAKALLASFLQRRDLLLSVHHDASSMVPVPPPPPPTVVPPAPRRSTVEGAPPPADSPDRVPRPAMENPSVARAEEASGPSVADKPKRHAVWSVILIVMGWYPMLIGSVFGAFALYHSWNVARKWRAGERDGARSASRRARLFNVIGTAVVALYWAVRTTGY